MSEPVDDEPAVVRKGDVSRVGTARALVLLAAVLSVAAAALVCFAALAFGPVLSGRAGLTGALVLASVVFALVVLVFAVVAGLLAARGRTVRAVVARGCGTLLAGILLGLAALLVLISTAS